MATPFILLCILFILGFVNGDELYIQVYKNISVMVGNDVRVICHNVSSPGPHPMWEKIFPEEEYKLISYNSKTTNTSRYSTINGYDLLIRNVQLRDEGLYRCENENEQYTAALHVSVPMEDLSLTWSSVPPFPNDSPVALVCRSTHSRPPADLRWYKGARQVITGDSTSLKTITDQNGFGNTESILSVIIDHSEMDVPYRCTADLPGQPMVQTAFLFPQIISSSTRPACYGLLLWWYIFLFWYIC